MVMMRSAGKGNLFAVLAVTLAPKVIDGMIDLLVMPSGLADLMQGKKTSESSGSGTVFSGQLIESLKKGYLFKIPDTNMTL